MSKDKTTLAGVQPGGRVRLGDQAERERFEAWPQAREFETQKDGSSEYLSEVTHGARLAWKYLSAQPSPGGQGDGIPRPLEDFRDATRHVIDCADGGDDYSCGRPMIDALTTLGILEKAGRGLWKVNAREAQAVFDALAARQPVGEPVVVAHRYIQRHQSAEHSVWLNGDADETYVEAERQGLGRIERAYAAPPAQAVDLGQFRETVVHWYTDADNANTNPAWVREEAPRLPALIDSKAVDNA